MAAPQTKQRFTSSLLFKIIVAIILGIAGSFFLPEWFARIFITFNGLFGNFLGFFIPVLIFALITPAIAGIGRGAGKWLAVTTAIAYASTVFSGALAYVSSWAVYPWLLAGETTQTAKDVDEGALSPLFTIDMPAPIGVMTALLLAFTLGVAMTAVKSDTLYAGVRDLERVIMRVITKFIIPLLPIYIFGMFLGMGMNGNLTDTLATFGKVLLLAVVMTIVLLFIQFVLAGLIAGVNPWRSFVNMVPAYGTALGTSSSAATIPVTYACTRKNGVAPSVAGFTIPLCATTHLAGSMMKICLFAFAIMSMDNMALSPALAFGFILMLGVTMVAAPGVPGGAIMAAVGLLDSMLGFSPEQQALMIAAYIAIDSFGTACNVTGDGAIALLVNRFAKGGISRAELAEGSGFEIDSFIEEDVDPAADVPPATAESAATRTPGR
ncbi:dicarboxylate/amino acid:cation symporter [Corynebacterium choanae]|uniref:C4-dicarboxylate transporter DctA n=1 Tax=Corynebacterium choanae TaxID=1862358 RepID=A0A3G6J990_9CORY|nr:dicarboxylate/amino acid:cation symporter [Corynebacterium choanae]AZA14695.1 C4-dicarboxylate transporter DctA [Corynebacterium choanae]